MLIGLLLIASSGATILSDSITLSISHSGLGTLDRKLEVLIESQQGREEFGDIEIRYDKEQSEFKIIEAYTETEDGNIYKPEKKAISDVSTPESHLAPMYSKNLLKVVSFPQVVEGSKLYYHYRIISKEPSPLPLLGSHIFGGKFPIKKEIFILKLPDTVDISFNIKPDESKKKEDFIIHRWERKDIERIKDSPHKPPKYEIAEELVFSSNPSWEELGKRIYSILKDGIQSCKRGEELEEIYSFVCDSIRTIPVSFQLIGLKPQPANEIKKNRYGCPRDKNILLISLLRGAGFDAFPVLVQKKWGKSWVSMPLGGFLSNVEEQLPYLSRFGGIITGVQMDDGIRFLDPSCEHCGSSYTPYEGKRAWIIKKDTSYFYQILPFKKNRIEIKNELSLSEEGSLEGKINCILTGYFSRNFQNWIESKNEAEKEKYLKSVISRVSMSAKLDTTIMEISKDEVRIVLEFRAPRYTSRQDKYLIFELFRNPVGFFPLSVVISEKERIYPYYFRFSNAILKEESTILYPGSLQLSHLPETMNLSNEGYKLTITTTREKGKIKYLREVSYQKRRISETSRFIPDMKKFLNEKTNRFLFERK